jgi:hypothetical protein
LWPSVYAACDLLHEEAEKGKEAEGLSIVEACTVGLVHGWQFAKPTRTPTFSSPVDDSPLFMLSLHQRIQETTEENLINSG